MKRLILIAGAAVILGGGAAGAATAPSAAPAPPAGQTAMPPGHPPGGPGMGMPGRMRGGPGMRGMRHGRMGRMGRTPPTAEQVQARNAALFAELDANRDGRATFEEFRALQERRRLERQRRVFQGLSGGQDSVTLEQLNTRSAERMKQREARRGGGGGAR
jgi:hypothetical protein